MYSITKLGSWIKIKWLGPYSEESSRNQICLPQKKGCLYQYRGMACEVHFGKWDGH